MGELEVVEMIADFLEDRGFKMGQNPHLSLEVENGAILVNADTQEIRGIRLYWEDGKTATFKVPLAHPSSLELLETWVWYRWESDSWKKELLDEER